MKKIFKIGIALVALVALCVACKKYQDDPIITLQKPEQRIPGKYRLVHYYMNGIDSVDGARYLFYKDYHITISASPSHRSNENDLHYDYNTGTYIDNETFYMEFVNNEKQLHIHYTYHILGYFIFVQYISTWDVIKLSDNKLWVSSTINGNYYEIQLEK
jgi:hypothetical protein